MQRLMLASLFILAVTSGGCATPARYIERQPDSGVIAIPTNTNAWPSYNRNDAFALIQKHVGSDYEIVEEREVATGQTTHQNQLVDQQPGFNPGNPLFASQRQTVQQSTTTQDVTEWRIAYRKRSQPLTGGSQLLQHQTQYPSGAVIGTQPAGGIAPGVGPVTPAVGFAPVGRPGPFDAAPSGLK